MQKTKNHSIQYHHFVANREKVETVADFIFLGSKITVDSDWAMKLKDACSLGVVVGGRSDKPRQHIKQQRHHFANKSHYSQSQLSYFKP